IQKAKRPEAQTSGPAHLFAFCLFAFALLSDFGLLGLQCFSGFSVWRVGGRSFERRGVQLSSFGRRRLGSFSRNLARGGGHFSLVASHCGLGNLWRTRRHIGRASLATAIAAPSASALPAFALFSRRFRSGGGLGAISLLADLGSALLEHLLALDDRVGHLCREQPHSAKRVVVARHYVVNTVRTAVRVDNSDRGDAEFVCFVNRDFFLVLIDDKDHVRQASHIANASQILLERRVLTIESEPFLFGQRIGSSIGSHRFDVLHSLDRFLNRLKIRQQPTEPTLVDVILAAAFGLFLNRVLRLTLCADEHEALAIHRLLGYKLDRFLEKPLGLLKVNDVDSVALAEDILLHLRIPPPDLMPKMDASFKQLFHRYSSQSILLRFN